MSEGNDKFSMLPIKKTDVFKTIIDRIENLITDHLKPGDRLPAERELAEKLGVSRTSVRQALKVIEANGLVETKVGSGTYVCEKKHTNLGIEVNRGFLEDLIVARTGIEKIIFMEAMKKMNTHHFEELRNMLKERDLEIEDESEDGGLDLSFESKVGEYSNSILFKVQQMVHQWWIESWRAYGFIPEHRKKLHEEHLKILNEMERGNYESVFYLITNHINKKIETN